MERPLNTNLPADLPEDWQLNQKVSPTGVDVGLTEKHGYNYQSKQINDAQKSINALNEEFDRVQEDVRNMPSTTAIVDADTVPVVEAASNTTKKITFANIVAAIRTKFASVFAAIIHTHGNISNDGNLGTAANNAAYTGSGGKLIAGTLPVAAGGTGATSAEGARTNLGITPENIGAAKATHNHDASDINAGTLSLERLSTMPITKGGTGGITAPEANRNLTKRALNTAPAEDLPTSYPEGIFVYIETSPNSALPYKPSEFGLMLSMKGEAEVSQFWFTQPNGIIYRRGGNTEGWNSSQAVPTNRGWVPVGSSTMATALLETEET